MRFGLVPQSGVCSDCMIVSIEVLGFDYILFQVIQSSKTSPVMLKGNGKLVILNIATLLVSLNLFLHHHRMLRSRNTLGIHRRVDWRLELRLVRSWTTLSCLGSSTGAWEPAHSRRTYTPRCVLWPCASVSGICSDCMIVSVQVLGFDYILSRLAL